MKVANRITVLLAIISLMLLLAVILLFNQRLFLPSSSNPINQYTAPVIERTKENNAPKDQEPNILELENQSKQETGSNTEQIENKSTISAQSTVRLFFIRVSDEGRISTKSILRTVKSDAAPLTAAIQALINGPGSGELSTDILSLIPENSQLINARVENNIAFLNFNENFRFNSLGLEGYKAQVEQVVFTATEFPTVEKVQFLISGQTISYLGGEGFWIGSPIGREDL